MQQRWLLLPKIKPASGLLSASSSYGFAADEGCRGSVFILAGMFSVSLVKKKKKKDHCFMV